MGSVAGYLEPESKDLDLCMPKTVSRLFRALFATKAPVSLDGYLMPCNVQGYMLFSQTCRTPTWVRIPVARIKELEWLGHNKETGQDVEHVRITL